MKTTLLSLVAALVCGLATPVLAAEAGHSDTKEAKEAKAAKGDKPAGDVKKGRGKLVHMVAFKFKETATADDIRKVEQAFAALPGKIPQIATYETGTNVSPEKLDKGFTHAFLLTFHSSKDRDDYLVHPDHKAFGALLGPYLADAFVMDFWSQKSKADGKPKKAKAKANP